MLSRVSDGRLILLINVGAMCGIIWQALKPCKTGFGISCALRISLWALFLSRGNRHHQSPANVPRVGCMMGGTSRRGARNRPYSAGSFAC
eukprot:3434559-Amphidinium_carterae.1